jgi:hypothetical protein
MLRRRTGQQQDACRAESEQSSDERVQSTVADGVLQGQSGLGEDAAEGAADEGVAADRGGRSALMSVSPMLMPYMDILWALTGLASTR